VRPWRTYGCAGSETDDSRGDVAATSAISVLPVPGGETKALPAVWQKKSDFLVGFDKLTADAETAAAAIKDEASFKTGWPKVTADCGGCQKDFRGK
jgi:cytochrome c556